MSQDKRTTTSRREFLKHTGRIAATSAVGGIVIPRVHAAENHTLRLALIGCGSRGSGAVVDALSIKRGSVKLVAMADVVQERIDSSYAALKKQFDGQINVSDECKFVGFDSYRHAMDCLAPGDIVILTTPLAFRWVHFAYAIQKGLNLFMEKPLTADGPTSRRMLKLAEQAKAKNLKVGVGLMSRHSRALQQLAQRIHDGEIGELLAMRAYREHVPMGSFFSTPKPAAENELLWQIRRFHSFLWASGGAFSDGNIHLIDGCCWMKNAWPIQAKAIGGRHYRNDCVDQNFDNYSIEYTFPDETKLFFASRYMFGCHDEFASYGHGTKGLAVISKSGDCGQPSSIYQGQIPNRPNLLWKSESTPEEKNPYQNEWNDLVDAIRDDKPYNEVPRGVKASLVASMGRMAAHTGQLVTYDEMLHCEHEFAPTVDKLTMDSPAPVLADRGGKYPVPQPGIVTEREF